MCHSPAPAFCPISNPSPVFPRAQMEWKGWACRYWSRSFSLCSKPPAASTTAFRARIRNELPSRSATTPATRPPSSKTSSLTGVESATSMSRLPTLSSTTLNAIQPVPWTWSHG